MLIATLACSHGFAAPIISGEALLALPAVDSATEPGQYRQTRLSKDQPLSLGSDLAWDTSIGLTATQYIQPSPMRTQSARFSTGPNLQLGRFEFALPMQSGYELGIGQGEAMWTSNTPRITLTLGPNDRVRLEARTQNRTEQRRASLRKSKKSIGVSWRHAFNDRYSLKTGMGRNQELIDDGLQRNQGAEVYAQMYVRLPDNWQFSLLGSMQTVHYAADGLGSKLMRDQSSSLVLSVNRGINGRWLLSGSFSIDQNGSSGLRVPTYTQSGQVRLTRDF